MKYVDKKVTNQNLKYCVVVQYIDIRRRSNKNIQEGSLIQLGKIRKPSQCVVRTIKSRIEEINFQNDSTRRSMSMLPRETTIKNYISGNCPEGMWQMKKTIYFLKIC